MGPLTTTTTICLASNPIAPPGKGDINTAPSTNQKSQECAGSNLTKNQFRSRCVRAGIFLKLLAKSEPLFPTRQGFSVHSLSSLPSIPWEGIFATPLCCTLLIIQFFLFRKCIIYTSVYLILPIHQKEGLVPPRHSFYLSTVRYFNPRRLSKDRCGLLLRSDQEVATSPVISKLPAGSSFTISQGHSQASAATRQPSH